MFYEPYLPNEGLPIEYNDDDDDDAIMKIQRLQVILALQDTYVPLI